ncbi:MAG: hypothetical protein ACTTIW_06550 [Porphyromonas sp.]
MKRIIYTLCTLVLMLLSLSLTTCHKEEDALMTTLQLKVVGSDMIVEQIIASADLSNLNTSEVTSISITSGDGTRLSTLRGIYRITMQGTVTYRLSDGSQHTRRFRAAQDLVDVSRKQGNQVRLTLHFL